MVHHPGHHPSPRMRRLHGNVGHPGYDRRSARDGHLNPVRMSTTDNVSLVEHSDGAIQVEMRPQYFWVIVQPVAMSPRLSMKPLNKLVSGYGPHFQHRVYSPSLSIDSTKYL